MSIATLNEQFAINETNQSLAVLDGPGGISQIDIRNQYATCRISLQGAQLLSWVPQGQQEVIWLSDDAIYAQGKSLRGGIPICWPWFGVHEQQLDWPSHGFARTRQWKICTTEAMTDGRTRIGFKLESDAELQNMWPQGITVEYQVMVGEKLELELTTRNKGDEVFTLSQALHTYFNVQDVRRVVLHGLNDTEYLDKPDGYARKFQAGPVTIDGEVDRVYLNTITDCVIDDPLMKRQIVIIKVGSKSTVVWNPGQQVAKRMGDLGSDGYLNMLCVETANAADDQVSIEPGEQHQLWVEYAIHPA